MKFTKKICLTSLAVLASLTVAVSANYTDMEKIDQKEAVAVLSATQIMEGNPDGSFRPDAPVTRAEMAKMLTEILDLKLGTTNDFTDCNTHWANGYISAAFDAGLISGHGDGTFAPDDTVTGREAAKMILVALGYNGESFVGQHWETAIDEAASMAYLMPYVESENPSANLTRQEAAALLLSGLESNVVGKDKPLFEIQFPNLTQKGSNWFMGGKQIYPEVEKEEEEQETTKTNDLVFIHGGSTGSITLDGEFYYIYDSYLNGKLLGDLRSKNEYKGDDATIFYNGVYLEDGKFDIQYVQKTTTDHNKEVVNQAGISIDHIVDGRWISFRDGDGVFGDDTEFNCTKTKVCDLSDNKIDSVKDLEKVLENHGSIEVAVVGNTKDYTVDYIYVLNVYYRS